jgi:hypothetical protein
MGGELLVNPVEIGLIVWAVVSVPWTLISARLLHGHYTTRGEAFDPFSGHTLTIQGGRVTGTTALPDDSTKGSA